ncbi:type II toxin-antitoxin system PemK/MazF family toxin [Pandoraea cepalis]|uniref:type II toxin-antitoxin system PemK/MazF family toxin n=1 Tax=Pandoraea cepalis TaxID=2508294 RepID=UPI0020C502C5|nr:type II toxin-antitoxin system PemK/MazF family toxin [Pandoraea cepalis]
MWVVSLDPAIGCEIRKTRPCVVILLGRLGRLARRTTRLILHSPDRKGSRRSPF